MQAFRAPFVLPMDAGQKRAADAAKAHLSRQRGGESDHLALVAAFEGWEAAKRGGGGGVHRFCTQHFLSPGTCNTLAGLKQQLANELVHCGLVPTLEAASRNSGNNALVRAILAAGMYPQVCV